MHTQKGKLIVFEGCDRCGKTTQCDLLIEYLSKIGVKCQLNKFPNRTSTLGKMISEYLNSDKDFDDHCIHLMFSANRWEDA